VNQALLLLTWLTPLLAAPFAISRAGRWLPALATAPALAAALIVPVGSQATISWLLLGTRLGLDAPGRVFLLFTAILWLVAGLQAALTMSGDPRAGRFGLFYLLAMAGNLWLIVGQDLVSFYLGFSLMGLSAYGLVIHKGDEASLRAGRVYLAMTLVAEVALFAAFVLIARHTGTLAPVAADLAGLGGWAVGLLIFALGIKAGLVPLHVWLPLAHPAAPVPASAVLSGTMIKAALIGWLRFLPLGDATLSGWGSLLVAAGALTVLYSIPAGIVQTNPKVVLAYSSVGKMGLMSMLLGVALMEPETAPVIAAALVFYAAHHGLAKGALFLGVGVAGEIRRAWVVAVLALPALVLAGAPFTSGALAKGLVKPELASLSGPWAGALPLVLTLSTVGTTLLMSRFLWLVRAGLGEYLPAKPWIATPWIGLIVLMLALPFVSGYALPPVANSWPLLAGAGLALAGLIWRPGWATRLIGLVPPGDILEPLAGRFAAAWSERRGRVPGGAWKVRSIHATPFEGERRGVDWPASVEQGLRAWPIAGLLVLSLGAILFVALSLLP
jgi:hydrogenase-4 component B